MNRGAILMVALGFGLLAHAQTPTATVVGRITDPTGAVVPGVTVKVTHLDTNVAQQAVSNEIGEYTIPYLDPGRYALEASLAGFRTWRRDEFTLVVGQILRIDIPLEVGTAAETVTVSETPVLLNTETGTRGEVTSQEEIKELPLNGRDFSDLALLT
ncbi:MAG: carboxypeptidase-like regulatory domain-containing protein, partial [Bryobacteraceae bacterium]